MLNPLRPDLRRLELNPAEALDGVDVKLAALSAAVFSSSFPYSGLIAITHGRNLHVGLNLGVGQLRNASEVYNG